MADFTAWLRHHVKNVGLSSQRVAVEAPMLQEEVAARGGVLIPAHVFTPHKGLYGNAAARMDEVLEAARVPAVELGLSADAAMADALSELADKTFLSNSDAHSLANIGREYQAVRMAAPTFDELLKALRREEGRGVAVNYGLN
ncbi:endonuclease Q family protein, partial [Calditerricola satsumensis]